MFPCHSNSSLDFCGNCGLLGLLLNTSEVEAEDKAIRKVSAAEGESEVRFVAGDDVDDRLPSTGCGFTGQDANVGCDGTALREIASSG